LHAKPLRLLAAEELQRQSLDQQAMEEELHRRVVGQDEALRAVAKAIRRGRAGLVALALLGRAGLVALATPKTLWSER
jgi:ATP-dependent Clp protease ATP-binding subunit ClpA